MHQNEVSMLVVKPDGVLKGFVDPIRQLLLQDQLTITNEIVKLLKPATVEMLYWNISNIRTRSFFPELVTFMSSSPVHIFIVTGDNAVEKVRQIIGKREPASGIRAQWAESIIKNVAHGPHTPERAAREIRLLTDDYCMKATFVIGGMSESGKSTFGRCLEKYGLKRLKIARYLKSAVEREGIICDFSEWNSTNMRKHPELVFRMFTNEFTRCVEEEGIEYCCLESLYNPGLGINLKQVVGHDRVIIVYIDMDEETRVQRQMIRENLNSLDDARMLITPRDEIKREWGVPDIARVADICIDNSGSIESLEKVANELISQYCPELLI